ncbi:hypothetical protein ILYODFUR_019689 [Ilyodon furcidens]|uniref:Uncharacterized protein n=1 Tax=Ilyodon furcidens TaxID=33524 RepID=A0ABV0UIV2_9TELE
MFRAASNIFSELYPSSHQLLPASLSLMHDAATTLSHPTKTPFFKSLLCPQHGLWQIHFVLLLLHMELIQLDLPSLPFILLVIPFPVLVGSQLCHADNRLNRLKHMRLFNYLILL